MSYTEPPDGAAEEAGAPEPPLVGAGEAEVGAALAGGGVIAVPAVGGYCLAVHVGAAGEERLAALAADPEGPHYVVGHVDAVRGLTSGWSDELNQLLQRCWPGPVEVFLPRARRRRPGRPPRPALRPGGRRQRGLGGHGGYARGPGAAQAVP